MRTSLALGVVCLIASPVFAQVEQVTTPPPNLVVSNYYNVPVGPFGGLEGAAYVARVGDPSAAWFNPAGLARQNTAQISGSAGVYQRTSITPESLPNRGGSFQQLPNFVGFTFAPRPRLTVGAALVTNNAWNQETDSELITPVAGGQQRFAYSADSTFERRTLAFGAGYQGDGPGGDGVHLLGPLSKRVVRISPPLTITTAEATAAMAVLGRAAARLAGRPSPA